MTRRERPWVVGVLLVIVIVPLAFGTLRMAAEPDDPSDFYRPPPELVGGRPGTVVRQQDVSADVDGRVRKILYTSTDPDGRPIAVSGVVVQPAGEPPAGGWPVVAWAHGTSGVTPRCAPSLQPDAGLGRIPEVARLAAGHIVVATDYPGLGTPGTHPYLIGESEGRAVLDAVRAARELVGDGASAVTAVYGHSQGGHSTLYAAMLAPTYAPELDLVGVAPMAPPTDLGRLMNDEVDEPAGIVLTSMAITSWSALFPDLHESDIVYPVARPAVANIARACTFTSEQGLVDVPDVLTLKTRFLSADPASTPGWETVIRDNSPAGGPITVPVLVAQGLDDTIVRPDVTRAYVGEQCTEGAAIELRGYPGVGHFAVRTVAAPDVVDWVIARTAGAPAPTRCTTV